MPHATRHRTDIQPLYLGIPGRQGFGLYHPAAGATHGRALLICPSFGTEDVNPHATLRVLAQAAASHGIPTLRLAYPGTGDAEGDADTPDLFRAWQDSIVEAVAALRELSGMGHVSVLGLRLGALLAALAAPRCGPWDDFIAVAPVVSGRAYVREMKALHMAGLTGQAPPPDQGPGRAVFESGGFVMADATHQALSAIDLFKLDGAPASRALLIERDDLPGPAAKWAAHLTAQGARVDHEKLAGYADMMADPHHSATPASLLPMVLRRLETPPSGVPAPPAMDRAARMHGTLVTACADDGGPIREEPVRIGAAPSTALFGILSRRDPAAPGVRPSGLGVLMLNAGATRHIGPNRLYVPLARHWASQGHVALRIDIAGLGESPAHPGEPEGAVYSRTAQKDVADALGWLRQQPAVTRIVLLGLCSGAYHALKSVAHDLPVDAAVLINPLTFFWHEGMSLDPGEVTEAQVVGDMMRHRQTMWQAGTWKKLLSGDIPPRRLFEIAHRALAWRANAWWRGLARKLGLAIEDDLQRELAHVGQRKVPLHFVFADTDPGLPMLHALGGASVQRLQAQGLLSIRTVAHADHTFTLAAPRGELEGVLKETMDRIARG